MNSTEWCHSDYCLSCERRPVQGGESPYCSTECYNNDHRNSLGSRPPSVCIEPPSEPPRETSSTDYARIRAWRQDVAPGAPKSSQRPKFSLPKLISPSRPLAPSLTDPSSSSSGSPTPSRPIATPHSVNHATPSFHHSSESLTMTTSYLTESVATPHSGDLPSPPTYKSSRFDKLRTAVVGSSTKHSQTYRSPPAQPNIRGIDSVIILGPSHRGLLTVSDEDLIAAEKPSAYSRGEDMVSAWLGPPPSQQPSTRRPLESSDLANGYRGRRKGVPCMF